MGDEKKEYEVTAQGSLGLLALGDIGLEKWREAVQKKLNTLKEKENNDGEEADK